MVAHLFKVHHVVGDYRKTHTSFQNWLLSKNVSCKNVIGQIVNFGSLENKMIKEKDNMKLLIELRNQNRYGKQVYDHSMSNMSTMIICVVRLSSIVLLKSGKVY
ncbi:unnamed protein product, partial [Brassica napus]